MASAYLKLICKVQPEGPYLLAGASAGGVISFEIAHQLLSYQKNVTFLGLLDSWVPHPEKMRRKELFEAVMRRQYHQMQDSFTALGLDSQEFLVTLQWQRVQMLDRYEAKKIDMPLTLFKALEVISIYEPYEDPLNHWETYSTYPVKLYQVPGDHETIFNIHILRL